MAELTINGRKVTVDDSFMRLSPDEQNATVDEIAKSIGTQSKTKEFDAQPWYKKAGQAADDVVRLGLNGASFGFMDKAAAGLNSIMPGGKSYDDEIAAQRQATQGARQRAGLAGTVAELGGGIVPAVGLANAGVTAARAVPSAVTGGKRLAALMGAGAVDGAALGAIGGAGQTDDGGYLASMLGGGAVGAGIGAAAPAVVAGAAKLAAPVRDAVAAQLAPESFARRAATGAMNRAGMTPEAVRQKMTGAAADGQSEYMVADALGNGGARALNGVARGNDPVSSRIVEALQGRQAGQGQRVESIVREGLDAPTTGDALLAKLTGIRSEKGAQNYGAAREAATAVDTAPSIAALDARVPPVVGNQMAARGISESGPTAQVMSVRKLLTNEPVGGVPAPPKTMPETRTGNEKPWDSYWGIEKRQPGSVDVDNFSRALLAKQEMDAILEKGGTPAAFIRDARNELDKALSQSSVPYANARDTYRNLSKSIDAVETGRALGSRGLYQDTQNTLKNMAPNEIGAARYGYSDSILKRAGSLGEGANKGRALTAEKYKQEFDAIARPGRGEKMQRKLSREGDMFETSRIATGGSQTSNNLADIAAVGGGGIYDVLGGGGQGLGAGAAFAAARRGVSVARGNPSQAAREGLARALLSNNPDILAAMAAKQIKARDISENTVAAFARLLAGSGIAYQNLGGKP